MNTDFTEIAVPNDAGWSLKMTCDLGQIFLSQLLLAPTPLVFLFSRWKAVEEGGGNEKGEAEEGRERHRDIIW